MIVCFDVQHESYLITSIFPRKKMAPNSLFPAPSSAQRVSGSGDGTAGSQRQRQKVVLQPGHSPLDWAHLNNTKPKHELRGVAPSAPPPQYTRVSKDELKQHKTLTDCWTCINGKVFNITPYVDFHPGGVDEIMKCAGRDGTALFNKYHSWVSADRMLENCFVGFIKDN
ncbi:hypothetical protein CAAN1_25S01574 [[Candida] anglica]|uniref:Cytochrome b5 heme-binding domain-containing protein n=1 Tax=[Candida] anglica TaxID=148631 RepID=A0ABP0EDI8_9ASCO